MEHTPDPESEQRRLADPKRKIRLRELNDAFRASLKGGRVVMTTSVAALAASIQRAAFAAVRSCEAFNSDNDPYGEHDFGSFELEGQKFFWKIDYYDKNVEFGSPDPSDPNQTTRVLTIMLAENY